MTPDTLLSLLGLAMITTVIGGWVICIIASFRHNGDEPERGA